MRRTSLAYFVVLMLVVALAVTSCIDGCSAADSGEVIQVPRSEEITGEGDMSDSIVPESERSAPEGTVAVIYPAYVTAASGGAQEQWALASVDELVASTGEDITVEVSETLDRVTVTAGPEASAVDVQSAMYLTSVCTAAAQVMRTLGEDFSITVEAVDASTGEVMESYDQDTYLSWSSDFAWLDEGYA